MCNGVNLEKERKLFEQWFVTKYPYTSLDRDNGVVGTYWHERVEMSWQSWLSSISRESYKSQLVNLDLLQRKIAFQEKAIKNIKLQFENKQIDCDISDRKIDELQSRVDEALNILCKLQYSSGERIYGEVGSILKGNKDETGLN